MYYKQKIYFCGVRKKTINTDNDSLQQKEAEQIQDFIGDIGT